MSKNVRFRNIKQNQNINKRKKTEIFNGCMFNKFNSEMNLQKTRKLNDHVWCVCVYGETKLTTTEEREFECTNFQYVSEPVVNILSITHEKTIPHRYSSQSLN